MPSNKKGGKNYKKGKHKDDEPILYERLEGQMYGRIVRLLGGSNVLVFCNDNCERMCHIRGNMRKKVWLTPGDIVLVSLRDLDSGSGSRSERGDICAKYDSKVLSRLKEKDNTINDKLFTLVVKSDSTGQMGINIPVTEDGGFIFADDNENKVINNEAFDSDSQSNELMPANRAAQKKAMMSNDDDVNDDINDDDI